MKLIFKILIIFFLTSNYCFGQENKNFSFEIPYIKDSTLTLSYTLIQQKVEQLQLENFKKGIDSLGIRIWFNYGSEATYFNELVEICYSDFKWTGSYYPMLIEPDNDIRTTKISKSNKISVKPKFGWDIILCGFNTFDIKSLPLEYNTIIEKIDEETGKTLITQIFGGTMYIIEIATPSMYRFYEYPNLDYFADIYPEAKKMEEFLNFIKSQFSIFDMKFSLREKKIKKQATHK
ncbi:MAG: hypothetical protein K8R54_08865 [Bacteroidales bacterium]|nr:hypothetical protein [Bacteroidales bacterium]